MYNISTINNSRLNSSYEEPRGSFVLRMLLLTLVLLVAVFGNIVVIRAVYKFSFGHKPLTYTLVLNLAVGELLNVILMPFILVYEQTMDWIFGEFLCKIINPLQIMCLTNVTVTLAAIAVYRWRVFTSPKTRTVSPLKTKLLIGSFWLVGVTLAVPLLWLRDLTPRGDGRMRCSSWKTYDYRGVYAIVHNVVSYYVPFVLIFAAYARVGLSLQKHVNSTKLDSYHHSQLPQAPTTPTGPSSPQPCGYRESIQLTEAKTKPKEQGIIRMMYIIVFSFVICYIPYQLYFILNHVGIWKKWKFGIIAAGYFQWLMLLPSALHPIIYGTKSKIFAIDFSSLIFNLCKSCKY